VDDALLKPSCQRLRNLERFVEPSPHGNFTKLDDFNRAGPKSIRQSYTNSPITEGAVRVGATEDKIGIQQFLRDADPGHVAL
jgi:hypothetical protein